MRALQATQPSAAIVGRWRVYAAAPGAAPVEITFVRDVPIKVGDWQLTDPFGPQSCSLELPQVTVLDRIGEGELAWLAPGCNVDIVWDGAVPAGYPDGAFRWEGYMTSFDYSQTGVSVALVGAMFQLDNYLAKPEYPSRPIPYEHALARQWRDRPDLRLRALEVEWPAWWSTRYSPKREAPYLTPSDVAPGEFWTGLVTRQTGSWDPVLTGYMQTLLAAMYTDRGRWTVALRPQRRPVLRHLDYVTEPDAQTVVVDPVAPGVDLQLSADPSQSLNVVYGQGTSLTGEAFTGMQVSGDGQSTSYAPLAALRQVYPTTDKNGWLQPSRMRKEVLLQVQQGLDLQEARKVGEAHLSHFSDPGLTGSITLKSDPGWSGGGFIPRALIKAGMAVQVKGALGREHGVLMRVVSVSTSLESGTTTLTVDSKQRDRLTVDEVRLRGRDALQVSRLLVAGGYQPPVPDQLVPWNYAEGSGYIPGGPQFSSRPLFQGMSDEIAFPWESWTRQRPPRSSSWRSSYIRIGPARKGDYVDPVSGARGANNNWGLTTRQRGAQLVAFPIKMAQAGSIRLVQIAAYDLNGNVLKVPFHVSLYQARTANPASTPKISTTGHEAEAAALGFNYKIGQNWPFFEGAWETYKLDGTQRQTEETVQVNSVGLIRAWGTKSVPAGYWPGTKPTGDPPTGLLVDEGTFEFNLTNFDKQFSIDPYSTRQSADVGYAYMLIYCEAQEAQEVFFLGRMFRVEPGQSV